MGGLKKSKADKRLERRQLAWKNTIEKKTRGAGIGVDESCFHKPGSRNK